MTALVTRLIVSRPTSIPYSSLRCAAMSRTDSPPAYKSSTRSSSPAKRVWRLPTSCGSKLASRSRGVEICTAPKSVASVFEVPPLRTFPEAGTPPGGCPRCAVSSAANAASTTRPASWVISPPGPVISAGSRPSSASSSASRGNMPARRAITSGGAVASARARRPRFLTHASFKGAEPSIVSVIGCPLWPLRADRSPQPHTLHRTEPAGARRSSRERGKSDSIDAFSVARAALKEGIENLPGAHLDGAALDIRLLVDHREDLIAARTADQPRLRWHLHDLWPELEIPAGALDTNKWLGKVSRRLARAQQATRVRVARELVRQITARTTRIRERRQSSPRWSNATRRSCSQSEGAAR